MAGSMGLGSLSLERTTAELVVRLLPEWRFHRVLDPELPAHDLQEPSKLFQAGHLHCVLQRFLTQ